jgi:glycine hydroxymethyltransferase
MSIEFARRRLYASAILAEGSMIQTRQSTPSTAIANAFAKPFDGEAASAAYRSALQVIGAVEPEIAAAIRAELADQRSSLKLIASENYASPAVLLTMGTWLSDKYAEGTVGHRFYAACQNIDAVERLAADHAKALFGAPHAYVQPHSGIDANLVAFWAILAQRIESPALAAAGAKHVNDLSDADWAALRSALGDQKMLGMSLDAGGHLTHGFRPNISGKMFHQSSYGTSRDTELLDYAEVRRMARAFKPLILIAGYSAYPRKINFAIMREIADEVGATLLVPYAHVTTTTTHKSLRGPRGGMVLCQPEFAESVDRGCPMVLGGPLGQVMAAKAVALAEARRPEFATYAQAVADNAVSLASGLMRRGGRVVTGGTENHLVLLDVTSFGLTGRQAESALVESGIVTNRNAIPRDPNGAWYTSGVRLGTPALTSRGFGVDDLDRVASLIVDVLRDTSPTATADGSASKAKYALREGRAARTRAAASELLSAHPLYPGLDLG